MAFTLYSVALEP